mgnify:CR=1 FL=1
MKALNYHLYSREVIMTGSKNKNRCLKRVSLFIHSLKILLIKEITVKEKMSQFNKTKQKKNKKKKNKKNKKKKKEN